MMRPATAALAMTRSSSREIWSGWASDVAKAVRCTSASVTRNVLEARTTSPDGMQDEVTRCSPGLASPGTDSRPAPTAPPASGVSEPIRTPSKKKYTRSQSR